MDRRFITSAASLIMACNLDVGLGLDSTTSTASTSEMTSTPEPPTTSTTTSVITSSTSTDIASGSSDASSSTTSPGTSLTEAGTVSSTSTSTDTDTPSNCGNGVMDLNEACDDGNTDNEDGCNENCTISGCGDGFIQSGENCDDGNKINTDHCLDTCVTASCGDGHIQPDLMELCDDGNKSNEDDCNEACKPSKCGDGFVQSSMKEECDNGDANIDKNANPDANKDGLLDNSGPCNTACKRRYRYVFLSSAVSTGNLGGIQQGADKMCQDLADAAGSTFSKQKIENLKFRAWLSSYNPTESPSFAEWKKSDVPYVLPDKKTIVAYNYESLTKANLRNPIEQTEFAEISTKKCTVNNISYPCTIWTNTLQTGDVDLGLNSNPDDDDIDCNNWTSSSKDVLGRVGKPAEKSPSWTSADLLATCDLEGHLYCFEQP